MSLAIPIEKVPVHVQVVLLLEKYAEEVHVHVQVVMLLQKYAKEVQVQVVQLKANHIESIHVHV